MIEKIWRKYGFGISVIGIPAAILFLILWFGKVITHGDVVTRGKVLSVKVGLSSCVKLSQTTVGESSNVTYCVWNKLPPLMIGETITMKFTRSKLPFMDRVEVLP